MSRSWKVALLVAVVFVLVAVFLSDNLAGNAPSATSVTEARAPGRVAKRPVCGVLETFPQPQPGSVTAAGGTPVLRASPRGGASGPVAGWLDKGDAFTAVRRVRCTDGTYLAVSARVRGSGPGTALGDAPVEGFLPAGSTTLG